MAGIIGVDLAEALFQERPIHRPSQLRQRMVHVDDLIEPGAKQILLARLPSFPWPHLVPRRSSDTTENHESILQGIPFRRADFRQIRFPQIVGLGFQINGLGILHGRIAVELALLLALATLWGASYSFIKIGAATIPPITLIAARTLIAGLLLLIIMRWGFACLPFPQRVG